MKKTHLYYSLLILGLFSLDTKTSQYIHIPSSHEASLIGTFGLGLVAANIILSMARQTANTTKNSWSYVLSDILWDFQKKLSTDLAKETPIDKIKWSDTIKDKIDALLNIQFNLKFPGIPEDRFEAFPTTNSKISVLQNIEDFFDLPSEAHYKNFNPLVYEACIKKINELEKIRYKMDSALNQKIDKKIQEIKAGETSVDQLEEPLEYIKGMIGYHYYYSTLEEPFFDKNNPTFRAYIARLMHLLFKKSKQTSALSEQEKTEAMQSFQEKKKTLYSLKEAAIKAKEIKFGEEHDPEKVKKNLIQTYPFLSFTPLQQPSRSEEAITKEQEAKRKAFQEKPKTTTLLERLQGWWYGTK